MKHSEIDELAEKQKEAFSNIYDQKKRKEAKNEAIFGILTFLIAIPLTIWLFGKLSAWIAVAPVHIRPFTFS